ncbi:MAG: hypothetical protein ACRYGG_20940 [Janthinobacterium lividum]
MNGDDTQVETQDDLAAAVEVSSRMSADAVLLRRYCVEFAAVLDPLDPCVTALASLALQAGATCQAIRRVVEGRQAANRKRVETAADGFPTETVNA